MATGKLKLFEEFEAIRGSRQWVIRLGKVGEILQHIMLIAIPTGGPIKVSVP